MYRKSLLALLPVALMVAACAGATPTPTTEPIPPTEPTPYPAPQNPAPSDSYPAPATGSQPTSAYPAPATGSGSQQPGTTITTGYEPADGDEKLVRGNVFLEMADSQIVVMESFPVQVVVRLVGNLPDPCHQLRILVKAPSTQNRIDLEVYSLAEKGQACVTVLEPFEAQIPLGNFQGAQYSVWVNGEKLGEFDS